VNESLRIRELVTLGSLLAAGVAGTLVTLASRDADAQFVRDQRNPPELQAAAVERVVRTAPDPQTGRGAGVSASCERGSSQPLGNPWSCVVRYRSGKSVRIRVRLLPDGTYTGRYAGGGGASGCCIDLPGTR
jgi:hypothetical protein